DKTEWMEQHFGLTYHTSFKSDSLSKLQEFCTDRMNRSPEKIFVSIDFILLIKRDDLQIDEVKIWDHVLKWGLAQNPKLNPDPVTWSEDDIKMMETTLQKC